MEGSSQLYSSKSMAETLATSSSTSNTMGKHPRDLLQRFLGSANQSRARLDDLDEDDDGLNLGLGLSLGGKFGVDKSHKGLIRSSSIATTMPLFNEGDKAAPTTPAPVHTLVRTASLPVETEEEWRKRKEMQTLRRMEAKRRRSEKQRGLKEGAGGSGGEEKGVDGLNFRGRLKREQQCLGMNNNRVVGVGASSPSSNVEPKARRTTFGSLQGFLMAQSQGSGDQSQGGNSSGASELESKTHQGSSSCGEARSPSSIHSNNQDRGSQDSSSSKQPELGGGGGGEDSKRQVVEGGMEDMPCVFTIGSGPNGVRKVEGILYRFGKGEQVRIMCVCHGSFFSPAEFVKHAGGRDVDHPLRHIVVSPTASPFQ